VETLLFIASEEREFRGLIRHATGGAALGWGLDYARAVQVRGQRWLLAANGPGPELAAAAAIEALRRERVDAVVSTGFCGGLDPALECGDVVVASEVVDADSGERFAAVAAGGGRAVAIACCDRVVGSAEGKRELRQRTGAGAVDMESAALAREARRAALPFYAVRVVTDTAGETFHNDFNAARDRSGRFSRSAIARHALRRPLERVPELVRLARTARRAAAILGDSLAARQW
jgi:adenosylhomocysteine nucleosidase